MSTSLETPAERALSLVLWVAIVTCLVFAMVWAAWQLTSYGLAIIEQLF